MSRRKLVVIIAAAVVLGLAPAIALVQTRSSRAAAGSVKAPSPAGASACEYMAELCDGIGQRVAGEAGEARAASRITQWFGALGYAPDERQLTYKDADASRTSGNVVATKPSPSAEQIIIGAHPRLRRRRPRRLRQRQRRSPHDGTRRRAEGPHDAVHPGLRHLRRRRARREGLPRLLLRSLTAQDRAGTVLMINLDSVAAGDQVAC